MFLLLNYSQKTNCSFTTVMIDTAKLQCHASYNLSNQWLAIPSTCCASRSFLVSAQLRTRANANLSWCPSFPCHTVVRPKRQHGSDLFDSKNSISYPSRFLIHLLSKAVFLLMTIPSRVIRHHSCIWSTNCEYSSHIPNLCDKVR